MGIELSIILIAKENCTDLTDSLSYIFAQKSASNYEVICVKEKDKEIICPNQYKSCVKVIQDESLPKALNLCLKNIDSTYFTFMYPTDVWENNLLASVMNVIRQNVVDCLIYGMNLNKEIKNENFNTMGLNFRNFNPKYQEVPFLVSDIGKDVYYFSEIINNKIFRKEFFSDKSIYFEDSEDFEQLFYYKFMFSNPKFMLLNNYFSRRVVPFVSKPVELFEKVEQYIEEALFDDEYKLKLKKHIILKEFIEWINYKTPFNEYRKYNKKVKEKINEILNLKKIYEYELKMIPFYVRIYKFMHTNFLSWYFWWNKHCIK